MPVRMPLPTGRHVLMSKEFSAFKSRYLIHVVPSNSTRSLQGVLDGRLCDHGEGQQRIRRQLRSQMLGPEF